MSHINEIVHEYLEVFNETDEAGRRTRLRELFGGNGTYTDPHVDLRGAEQIDAFHRCDAGAVPPGFRFTLGSEIDAHHNQARFQWHAAPAGVTEPTYVGFDAGCRRRACGMYGFMDSAPA